MNRYTAQFFGVLLAALGMVSCGGGSGSAAPTSVPFASSAVIADCSGNNCAATTGTTSIYSGSGTGVWRFDNTADVPAVGTVTIQGVSAGKTVTLLYSNASLNTTASTAPSAGTLATPVVTDKAVSASPVGAPNAAQDPAHDHTSHHSMLAANRQIMLDMKAQAAQQSSASIRALKAQAEANAVPLPVTTVGAPRSWNENGFTKTNYATTAKIICPAGTLGRQVVIWVDNAAYQNGWVLNSELAAYQSAFCGTNNNDGAYAKVANAIGDVWGSVPDAYYSSTSIADTATQKQNVNIVILDPGVGADWGGYFYSLNNRLQTTSSLYANSNEALVFFVNARQSLNYTQSVLIHELTHMINYYQRFILNKDVYESWLEETTAMMTQDIFDNPTQFLNLLNRSACLPIVCDVQSYATSGAGISYFNWPETISNNHYYMGAAFGAYLNRRFGPNIYLQLTTDCYTAPANTSGRTCLDMLIKANGGESFDAEFARFGASVFGRMGGAGEPTNFGYPAKSGSVVLKRTNGAGVISPIMSYSLSAIDLSSMAIPNPTALTGFPYSTHTYRIDTVANGKTSYIRNNVSVPAKTSLTVVVK